MREQGLRMVTLISVKRNNFNFKSNSLKAWSNNPNKIYTTFLVSYKQLGRYVQ